MDEKWNMGKGKNYGEGSKISWISKQPDWFLDARGFKNLNIGLKKWDLIKKK